MPSPIAVGRVTDVEYDRIDGTLEVRMQFNANALSYEQAWMVKESLDKYADFSTRPRMKDGQA